MRAEVRKRAGLAVSSFQRTHAQFCITTEGPQRYLLAHKCNQPVRPHWNFCTGGSPHPPTSISLSPRLESGKTKQTQPDQANIKIPGSVRAVPRLHICRDPFQVCQIVGSGLCLPHWILASQHLSTDRA